jgi:hypothetical protein
MDLPIVCEWQAWKNYLAWAALPEVEAISIDAAASALSLAERVLQAGGGTAHAVLLHIDTSHPGRLPRGRAEFVARMEREGLPVWNRAVMDITKTRVQEHNARLGFPTTSAARDGDPDERVIVKSNFNAHGIPESQLPGFQPTPISGREYPVMRRVEVPQEWWSDDRLFVERYVENATGRFFRFYLAGELCVLSSGTSPDAVRRIQNRGGHRNFLMRVDQVGAPRIASVLDAAEVDAFGRAVAYSRTFGLDYGSLDLVMDDAGEPFVVDTNATPFAGEMVTDPDLVAHLRRGLCGPLPDMGEGGEAAVSAAAAAAAA